MHPLILHFHLDLWCTQSTSSIAWFGGTSILSLSCQAIEAPTRITLKIKPVSNPYEWWKYCKQANNKNLQNLKVLQTYQQQNPTQYEGIANKLTKEL
jgi:hypothetical protein